jgi:hypothetical protein
MAPRPIDNRFNSKETGQLDVAMQTKAKGCLELPMEVELGKSRYAAYRVEVQIAIQMPVDMIQQPLHPGVIVDERSRHSPHPL